MGAVPLASSGGCAMDAAGRTAAAPRRRRGLPASLAETSVARGVCAVGALVGAAVDGHWFALLGTGFCGGLTTYSAFSVQSVDAFEKSRRRGPAYVVMTVGGCLAMATLGHLLASTLP